MMSAIIKVKKHIKYLAKKLLSPFNLVSCPLPLGSKPINSKGFTLVELAVVLVILGTIFMSVLKVESMVKNAKIRQLFNQYRELRTAILVYKDKYGYLPGDDPYAIQHVGATHVGNGDSRITWGTPFENSAILEHLCKAGLINGAYDGVALDDFYSKTPLLHPFSTRSPQDSIVIRYDSGLGNVFHYLNLPYDVAQAFDLAFDDGVSTTGDITSTRDYSASATATEVTLGSPFNTTFPVGSVISTYIKIK